MSKVDVGVEPPGDLSLPRYGDRFRLSALEVDSVTVLVIAFARDGAAFTEHAEAVDRLFSTLEFEPR